MDKNVRGTNIFKEDIKTVHLTIKFDFNFFKKTIKFLDTFFIKRRKENVKQYYTKKLTGNHIHIENYTIQSHSKTASLLHKYYEYDRYIQAKMISTKISTI